MINDHLESALVDDVLDLCTSVSHTKCWGRRLHDVSSCLLMIIQISSMFTSRLVMDGAVLFV